MRRHRAALPTRLRHADAIGEAVASIVARPVRAIVTSMGIVLAVAWFVAALGLVSTAGGQVATAFAERLATQLRAAEVGRGPIGTDPASAAAGPFPPAAVRRIEALRGVVAAGVYWPLRFPVPVQAPAGPADPGPADPGPAGPGQAGQPPAGHGPAVIAASPGFLSAAGVRVSQGRRYGTWAQAHAVPVCLVGRAAARELGLTGLRSQPAVMIDEEPCAVIGIIGRATDRPSLRDAVLLPTSTATVLFGPPGQRDGGTPAVLIRTRPGAAALVARQAPYAISPAAPDRFRVAVPRNPQALRDQVTGTLDELFVLLGWVSLAAGVLSLANVTWLAVIERTPEYALRRAFGARRRHVAAHVLWEAAILGLLGGLAGASLGVAVVVLVAQARHWTPVVAPLTVLPAPLAGLAAGLVAGLVPAIRAARIQPAPALARSPAG